LGVRGKVMGKVKIPCAGGMGMSSLLRKYSTRTEGQKLNESRNDRLSMHIQPYYDLGPNIPTL
jgi:hypothetical protein